MIKWFLLLRLEIKYALREPYDVLGNGALSKQILELILPSPHTPTPAIATSKNNLCRSLSI